MRGELFLTLLHTLDRTYADRPLDRTRARALVLVYAVGIAISLVMGGHDLFFGAAHVELHLLNVAAMAGLQATGIVAVLRGRADLGGAVILPIVGVFTLASLTDAASGNPGAFYDGWARWYPAFIVAAMLFTTPAVAGLLTAWSIVWNALYFVLFCGDLPDGPRADALGEVWEVSAVDGLVGALAVAGMFMVRSAMRTAADELARNQALNADLESRVRDRTQALASRLAERQAILQHLGDGLVVLGADGRHVELANPALHALYGIQGHISGAEVGSIFPDDLAAALRHAWDAEDDGVVERELALPGGRIGLLVANRFGEKGRPLGVVAVVRDVTLQREVDRMKTEFISMASHELRTPLTSVLGFARIIERKLARSVLPALPADDERVQKAARVVRDNVEIIVSEGERLTALINDILDISKMEAGRMEYRREPLDLTELCGQSAAAVSSLFEDSEVALEVEIDDDLPEVVGDGHRLVQVLVNLLSNARKFTESGRIVLSCSVDAGGVELAVQDTGIGIAEEHVDAVFERFRQVGDVLTDKPRGTGLGLAICQQIVAAHGSVLELESTLGEGSRFSFVLAARETG
ncbi:MAG: PAS domain-containing protein [Alphaproteobacteria bacterium]|nr:PAS domain-containing protein [Alphaproteobacteria bacterium]